MNSLRTCICMVLFVPLQQEALGRELDTAIPSAEAGFSSLSFFWNAAGTYLGLLLSSAFASSNNNKNMFFLPGQPAEETRDALAVLRACQEPPAKEAPQSPTPQAFVRPLRWEWQNIECPRQDEHIYVPFHVFHWLASFSACRRINWVQPGSKTTWSWPWSQPLSQGWIPTWSEYDFQMVLSFVYIKMYSFLVMVKWWTITT